MRAWSGSFQTIFPLRQAPKKKPARDLARAGCIGETGYFFDRFLRPSASFSASPSFCAIFFFASE
jgi:hypothetical protein